MDNLWAPWRFQYVSQAGTNDRCVFCEKGQAAAAQDRENLILHRAPSTFIVLNIFPYTTGHALIAPYAHVANLDELPHETLAEMMASAQKVLTALKATYNPDGYNLGMNIGKCAGAGIAHHVHLHILPRWSGDTNFMTVTAEMRVQPEDLFVTYDKLVGFFRH